MAEEKDKDRVENPKPAAGKKLSLFLIPGIVFVVSLGVSAWMLGVFSPAPPEPVAETIETPDKAQPDTAAAEPANPMARQGGDRLGDLTPSTTESIATGETSYEDSIQASAWIARERERIAREDAEVTAKKRELLTLKKDLEQLLGKVQEARSERIAMMAKLYDNMESEAVAKQIANMDDRTVVMLLPQMNTRTAAKIMALIEPKRAAAITTKLLALEQ
jgi:flagellar motility protein MotE (MotC chaperone)